MRNEKLIEHSNISSKKDTETETEIGFENFEKNIEKNSLCDKDMNGLMRDVDTDTPVLPISYVNELHSNILNKYIQKLAPEIQKNDNSLKDKKEDQNASLIFENNENKDNKD